MYTSRNQLSGTTNEQLPSSVSLRYADAVFMPKGLYAIASISQWLYAYIA
ncbi:hypothetical protein [Coleofasciculus sp. FACHB-125]|nr:hypothetical protein [Coleofasciculus sp. FACHB-125]MBD1898697.1 hypothetical protein [Coleofasciculus sp. FACHB-125]